MSSESIRRSEIKKKRMNRAFVDTTKDMIIKKGFDKVTVRDVASETGYTVVTLYKHFENFEELLWQTREDIVNDVVIYLVERSGQLSNQKLIRNTFREYINYCLMKPNAFKFLFFYQQSKEKNDFTDNSSMNKLIELFTNAFIQMAATKELDQELLLRQSNTVFFTVHGMLTVYLSGNYGFTEDMLFQSLEDAMTFIIGDD